MAQVLRKKKRIFTCRSVISLLKHWNKLWTQRCHSFCMLFFKWRLDCVYYFKAFKIHLVVLISLYFTMYQHIILYYINLYNSCSLNIPYFCYSLMKTSSWNSYNCHHIFHHPMFPNILFFLCYALLCLHIRSLVIRFSFVLLSSECVGIGTD